MTQVIEMFAKGRAPVAIRGIKVEKQKLSDSIKLLLQNIKALSIGTVVGSIVGLIPAVGGQIAGLVSYDQSKKFSKKT